MFLVFIWSLLRWFFLLKIQFPQRPIYITIDVHCVRMLNLHLFREFGNETLKENLTLVTLSSYMEELLIMMGAIRDCLHGRRV